MNAEQYLKRIENKNAKNNNCYKRKELISFAENYKKQLLLHDVSINEVNLKFNEFANKQQDLDSEFVKIVNDNFWDLL